MKPSDYSQMMAYLTRPSVNKRSPMAGGGMLVQPSVDGSRPGYAMSKEDKAAYMREYYKKQVAPSRKMTEAGAQRVKRTKALDEYIKTLGKVVNTDDLYKKLEELGFEYDNINSKINKLKTGKLKGKTFTKKTQKIQDPRMDKDRLKELDKYAKYLKKQGVEGMGDTYKTSTEKAQQSIRNRAANRNFKFTLDKEKKPKDTFTESQKNKIKAAFNISDADFDTAGTQYGVPSGNNVPGEEGRALKRRYALVKDFVNRGFKEGSQKLPSGLLRKEDQLPLDIQTEIKTKYELPEDYINKATGKREWDFTRHKYGIPGTKGTPLRSLKNKIEYEFVRNPSTKKFKFVGDFKTPQGWIMAQMYRSGVEQGSPNYVPLRGKINGVEKIVGFTDNIVGEDFYVRDEFVQPGGKPMRLHPDFNDVKKFISVANKSNAPLEGTLKGMLKQIGVVDNRLTMTTLLNYLAKEEGYNAVQRGLVIHHKGGVFENATRDLQLLRNINNNKIQGAENRIRSVVNLGQTPDKADIKILKNNRARVTVGGQTFGAGPQTPGGAFRSYEKLIGDQIKQGKVKKESLLKFIDTEFGKLAAEIDPNGCGRKTGATGGRIGLKFGSGECVLKAKKRLDQIVLRGTKNKSEQALANQILKIGRSLKDITSIRGTLGPAALAFTAATEAGLVGYDMLAEGKTFREVVGDSVFNYALGPKTKIDSVQERNKRFRKLGVSEEDMGKIGAYESALQGIEQFDKTFEEAQTAQQRLDEANMAVDPTLFPGTINELQKNLNIARANVQDLYRAGDPYQKLTPAIEPTGLTALQEAQKLATIDRLTSAGPRFFGKAFPKYEESRQQRILDASAVENPGAKLMRDLGLFGSGFAGGGIAKEAGDPSGAMLESMNPDSQGLPSLLKRGRKG